ncbi:MAG: cation-transporting P-type ATPase, partial [candidate division KSB1 bacterium]|nr:cation-transporting P-type ATPase [candidate division KSB1 bacterium]
MKPFTRFSRTPPKMERQDTQTTLAAYWSVAPDQLLPTLRATPNGLQQSDAQERLKQYGLNTIRAQQRATWSRLLLSQFKSPLVIILIFAATVSGFVGEWVDASIVLAIVLGSTILGFAQEYAASSAVEKLRSLVTIKSCVLRDGQPQMLPSEQVVPGDVVVLSAGNLIPADGIVLRAKDFFVNQAVLTGETFPAEKRPGIVPAKASLGERTNCVFMGTNVSSGTAEVLIVQTGRATVFGQVAERLRLRPPETEFERGVRRFG